MLLAGCAPSSSPTPVAPRPSEALLQEPPPPRLVPDPDKASDADLALEQIEVAKWGDAYRVKFRALVAWVRGTLMGGKP